MNVDLPSDWAAPPSDAVDPEQCALMDALVAAHPFHRFCNIRLVAQAPGAARVQFPVDEHTANIAGVLHGGILYGLMDVTAFMALVPLLKTGERAVSHDVHTSVLRAVPRGAVVELRAQVDRRGRRVAFARVEAYQLDAAGDRLVGTGSVTKSILAPGGA